LWDFGGRRVLYEMPLKDTGGSHSVRVRGTKHSSRSRTGMSEFSSSKSFVQWSKRPHLS
jgi:hypothetical protein